MKQASFLFVILFFFINSIAQTPNDLSYRNLKNQVKSVTTISYKGEEKFGEVVKAAKKEKEYEYFNKDGNLTESLT